MLIKWRIASMSAVLAGGVLGVAACGQAPPPSAPVVSLPPEPPALAGAVPAAPPPATPASASPLASASPEGAPASATPNTDLKEDPAGNLSRDPDAAFGGLAIGVTDTDVIKLLGPPANRGKIRMEAAFGLKLSTWTWPAKGVLLDMDWTTKPGQALVYKIRLQAPSTLKNRQGIGIGSTRAEVLAAVGSRLSGWAPPNEHYIVMGSPYDGVEFNVTGGRVQHIIVGASAPE